MNTVTPLSPDIVEVSSSTKRLPRTLWLDPDIIDPEAATSNTLSARKTGKFSSNLRSAYDKVSGAIGSAAHDIRSAFPGSGPSAFQPLSAQNDDPPPSKSTDKLNCIKQIAVYVLVIAISVTIGIVIGHFSTTSVVPDGTLQTVKGTGETTGLFEFPALKLKWRVNPIEKIIRIFQSIPVDTTVVQTQWIPAGVTLTAPHYPLFIPTEPRAEKPSSKERAHKSRHHVINNAVGRFVDKFLPKLKDPAFTVDMDGKNNCLLNPDSVDKLVAKWEFNPNGLALDLSAKEVKRQVRNCFHF